LFHFNELLSQISKNVIPVGFADFS